jgi:8-oxo-dGTP pyrophosphatase MutT (NUDIX family)
MVAPKVIFETKWIKVKETGKGFQYLERKGTDSVAVFLLRSKPNGYEVLIRMQPLCIHGDDYALFPCPITGSIDENELPINTAIRETYEEAGYKLNSINYLGNYIVGTQTNETVHMFYELVDGLKPEENKGDGGFHESISKNEWKDLESLKNFGYSGCKIGYLYIKERINTRSL